MWHHLLLTFAAVGVVGVLAAVVTIVTYEPTPPGKLG